MRVVKEVMRLFPISHIAYEVIKAHGNKSFSPAMVGQFKQLEWLSKLAPVITQFGWQTSILRQELGLAKDKNNKAAQTPESHANDGLALAASHFVRYESFQTNNSHGHRWNGSIQMTTAPFRVIARPNLFRRQLHFENPVSDAPDHRKRKGGTVTPFELRSGDKVRAEKAKKVYQGWIGGYSEINKVVSLYDINWKRIGQFSVSKVRLLKRSTRLLIST